MDSEGQPVPLTVAQRRALGATLHVVEEAVDAVLGEISEPLASILRALASARPGGTCAGCAPPAGVREPQP